MLGTDVSVSELDALAAAVTANDGEIDELEARLKLLKKQRLEASEKLIFTLQKAEKKFWRYGNFNYVVTQRATVTTPKTVDEKRALFDWLEARGIYWEYAGINSQALNALYKAEREAAVERGDLEFSMPGVGPENIVHTLSIRK